MFGGMYHISPEYNFVVYFLFIHVSVLGPDLGSISRLGVLFSFASVSAGHFLERASGRYISGNI